MLGPPLSSAKHNGVKCVETDGLREEVTDERQYLMIYGILDIINGDIIINVDT